LIGHLLPLADAFTKVDQSYLLEARQMDDATASNETLVPLLACVVLAAAILIPSLTYLFRVTLRGTLDQEFHPIGAADPPGGAKAPREPR
jgi:hypothetical protein